MLYHTFKQFVKKILAKTGLYVAQNHTYQPIVVDRYSDKNILSEQAGNAHIADMLKTNQSFMVARFGSVELNIIRNYIQIQESPKKKWVQQYLTDFDNNAGFFPIKPSLVAKFCELYVQCIQNIDVLPVWFNEGEENIVQKFCSKAVLTRLRSLEPYYHANPWSKHLAGKKVLVIHPFAQSIQKQYTEKRELLFQDQHVLPAFTLDTIQAVQSIADNKNGLPFSTWFDALDHMSESIHKKEFDIAIIGAGAYGLPIASFVKSIGKQAIHMAGATQILFGVWGERWETSPIIKGLQNEHWVRPSAEEKPKGAEKVENACYW